MISVMFEKQFKNNPQKFDIKWYLKILNIWNLNRGNIQTFKIIESNAIKNYHRKSLNVAIRVNSNTNFKEFGLFQKIEAFKTFSTPDI